ncbi:MAG: prolipoprotein diacylglyceryl transferase [Terriglobales bacterium]
MLPVLFHLRTAWGEFNLPTYGLMAALGLIVGLSINVRLAKRQGIDPDVAWNLGIYAILSGILGAKILFVLQEWSYYSTHPGAIFSFATLQAGGIWYGGLLGALAVSIWYVQHHRLPVLKTCDAFAPGVALGHAFGRLGCFAAGCCFGKHTDLPWGVTFTNPIANQVVGTPLGIQLHPTQIHEFLVELANFFILLWLFKRKKFDGQVIGAYLFLYGFARYFLEFLRDDPGRGTVFGGAMSVSQFVSILLVVVGGSLWMRRAGAPAMARAAR